MFDLGDALTPKATQTSDPTRPQGFYGTLSVDRMDDQTIIERNKQRTEDRIADDRTRK